MILRVKQEYLQPKQNSNQRNRISEHQYTAIVEKDLIRGENMTSVVL